MNDKEYKIGYIGAFTIKASSETMAQRKLIDWLRKCPYGCLDMGRFIDNEKVYEQFNNAKNNIIVTDLKNELNLNVCKENGYEVNFFNINEIANHGTFNPYKAFTENADNIIMEKTKTMEEKEIDLIKLLEISRLELGKLYAEARLKDMSFLDDEPEWKEKATKILKDFL